MKAVVDTNVLVSSFLSPAGVRAKVLKAWEKGQLELVEQYAGIQILSPSEFLSLIK